MSAVVAPRDEWLTVARAPSARELLDGQPPSEPYHRRTAAWRATTATPSQHPSDAGALEPVLEEWELP
jgi:hypothetical protein